MLAAMSSSGSAPREARLAAARRSPELANLHDERGWLALYAPDAIVEDPVGTPACQRGVRTRAGGRDDLERFYTAFIAPSRLRVESLGDVVVGDTVVRDVVLHVVLPGGGGASVPAILQYELVSSGDALLVRRMRAYWDAGRNGRELLASGWRGKLTSMLSGVRLLRVLGKEWAGRYVAGTKRGIRRDGPPLLEGLAKALAGEADDLDARATSDATVELPGRASTPLRSLDRGLGLRFERAWSSGFSVAARCTAVDGGRAVSGIALADVDPGSKKIANLRLFWE